MIDILSPVRHIVAKAELYSDSALVGTYTDADRIVSVDIQRTSEDSKFFGVATSQRLNIHLIDKNKDLSVTTAYRIKVYLGTEESMVGFPTFYVSETHRDEKTNELSITAYDLLSKASNYTVDNLQMNFPCGIVDYMNAVSRTLGTSYKLINVNTTRTIYHSLYNMGANYSGSENLRDVIRQMSEATQTIAYIDEDDNLCFKRLSPNIDFNINKEAYFDFKSAENKRLQTIASVTELGNNVSVSTTLVGSTQYIRDNPFLENANNTSVILNEAIADIGNMTINTFDCTWRGNPELQLGNCITIVGKDDSLIKTYLLNDTITYNGALKEKTQYVYDEEATETSTNAATLGEKLNQTVAKVDKINKVIELRVQETEEKLSTLTQTSDSLVIKVEGIEENGVDKITTGKGFTFDDDGLTITDVNSPIKTNIDEDGLSVFQDNTETLTADVNGVRAVNLTSKQYLIIGKNSRFEDYGNRTACFYIGG